VDWSRYEKGAAIPLLTPCAATQQASHNGTIVIEGRTATRPECCHRDTVGNKRRPRVTIAVDPLAGTTLVRQNAGARAPPPMLHC